MAKVLKREKTPIHAYQQWAHNCGEKQIISGGAFFFMVDGSSREQM